MSVTKSTVMAVYDNSTVANYKSWAQAIGTLMAGIGWTRLASATGSLALASCGNASADGVTSTDACTVYTFSATQANFATFVGLFFTVSGFTNAVNNGTWTCVASTSTTITLANASGTAETHAATCSGDCGQVVWGNITVPPVTNSPPTNALVNFRGAWAKNTAYTAGDVVNDGSASYLCATSQPANIVITAITTTTGVTTITFASQADAGTNNWVGLNINISGFSAGNVGNNGNFTITSNTSTTATFANGSGTSAGASGATLLAFNSGPGTKHLGTAVYSNLTAATSSNKWISYNYEIWTNSSSPYVGTLPYYVQFMYGASSGRTGPEIWITQGTGASASTGVLSGNQFNGTAASQIRVALLGTSGGNNNGTPLFEMDICGGTSNFTLSVWRNFSSAGAVFFVDYCKDQNGNDLDTYYFVGIVTKSASVLSQCVFKPGSGTMNPFGSTGAAELTMPAIHTAATSAICNGLTPASPIFPNPGWTGNPTLGAVVLRNADCTDGELINVVLYGATHTYMVCKNPSTAVAGVGVIAMRWENA
jgi:hypothetical protein